MADHVPFRDAAGTTGHVAQMNIQRGFSALVAYEDYVLSQCKRCHIAPQWRKRLCGAMSGHHLVVILMIWII
jgi:hypothetical protein